MVIKLKLSLAAILSTSAIASGILIGSASSVEACGHFKSDFAQEHYEQNNWLRTPLALMITIPGIAIATSLSLGHRSYNR